jgi:cytochrome c-type biogenesis protein
MAALAPASVNALVYSSSLVAAFLGGILALFAPCCVVSLLPTFVAVAIERGRRRLPTTALIFSAGVATVLLPIVLGVGALGQLVARYQRAVFLVIGVFLAFLGVSILWGRGWTLPMPSLRLRVGGSGPARVFTLGLASGVASSCCAPVVIGVVAMSALAASPLGALGLALAYVVGMVFPLFVAALFSDRLPQRWVRAATDRRGISIGNRQIAWQDLLAGGMFLAVAAAALALAVTGRMSYAPDWLTSWNRWATGLAGDVAVALRGLPIVVQAAGIAVLAALVGVPLYRSWRAATLS